MRPLNFVYIAPLISRVGGWFSNVKFISENKKKGLCILFFWSNKAAVEEGHIVVVEESDIWSPECVYVSLVSVHVFVSLSFHQIRLLCSNGLLIFLNKWRKYNWLFHTRLPGSFWIIRNSLLLSAPNGFIAFLSKL